MKSKKNNSSKSTKPGRLSSKSKQTKKTKATAQKGVAKRKVIAQARPRKALRRRAAGGQTIDTSCSYASINTSDFGDKIRSYQSDKGVIPSNRRAGLDYHSLLIGSNIDYKKLWEESNSLNDSYIPHFSKDHHLLRIIFKQPESGLPLFNHDAIFLTLKGIYNSIKNVCNLKETPITQPLFLFSIERNSVEYIVSGVLSGLIILTHIIQDIIKIRNLKLDNEYKLLRNEEFKSDTYKNDVKRVQNDIGKEGMQVIVKNFNYYEIKELTLSNGPLSDGPKSILDSFPKLDDSKITKKPITKKKKK